MLNEKNSQKLLEHGNNSHTDLAFQILTYSLFIKMFFEYDRQ